MHTHMRLGKFVIKLACSLRAVRVHLVYASTAKVHLLYARVGRVHLMLTSAAPVHLMLMSTAQVHLTHASAYECSQRTWRSY